MYSVHMRTLLTTGYIKSSIFFKRVINHLWTIIYFMLPLLYFFYLLYIRLLRTKMPRNIIFFSSTMSLYTTIFIILGLFFRLYFLLKNENIIKTRESNKFFKIQLKKIAYFFDYELTKIKKSFLRVLAVKTTYYEDFVLKIIQLMFIFMPSKSFTIFYLLFNIIPRIIVVLVFLIDVFYFRQLDYFYRFIGLLLLPIIFSIFQLMVEVFYIDNIQDLVDLLDSKPIPNSEYDEFCYNENKIFPDSFPSLERHLILSFYPIYEIPYHLGIILGLARKYKLNKIKIIVCLLYLLGWLHILLVGLGIF